MKLYAYRDANGLLYMLEQESGHYLSADNFMDRVPHLDTPDSYVYRDLYTNALEKINHLETELKKAKRKKK